MPDYGRDACYRAERMVTGYGEIRLSDIEISAMVAEIHRLHGDGKAPVRVEFGNLGGAWARPLSRLVKFGRARCPMLVCHEMAHIYAGCSSAPLIVDVGHGPAWRREYVRLVRAMIGEREARELTAAFFACGVPIDAEKAVAVRKPRTRPNRRWIIEWRKETSNRVLSVVGNVTTRDVKYSEWAAISAIEPQARARWPFGPISPADKRNMRNGYRLLRGDVEIRMRAESR